MQADAPKQSLLPQNDILGVTVVLLTCSYLNREFIRIGYYVNNEYTDEELKENPPATVIVEKLQRIILAEKPKVSYSPRIHFTSSIFTSFCTWHVQVTKFPISWDPNVAEVMPDIPQGEMTEESVAQAMQMMVEWV